MGILNWLKNILGEQRTERATRYAPPGIVAFYWDGGAPKEHPVKDISATGAYLYAKERWSAGTVLALTLQEVAEAGQTTSAASLSLHCRVVRQDSDGIGITYMVRSPEERAALKSFMKRVIARTPPTPPALRRNGAAERGQALIEYALMVPLLFLFIVSTVNFGGLIYSWVTVANAARAGSQFAAMGSSYASYPVPAQLTAIQTLVQNETSALPNSSSTNPVVTVCQNNTLYSGNPNGPNPTTTATITDYGGGTCPTGVAAPPSDPETITGGTTGSAYTTIAIDVTYTYTAFIKTGFKFAALDIITLAMPTTVHRRTVMRALN